MASTVNSIVCACVALAFWTAVGLPVAKRLLSPSLALPIAPLAGWAMHSVVALPIFFVMPFSASAIAAVAAVTLASSWLVARVDRVLDRGESAIGNVGSRREPRISAWAWAGAVLLAIAVASAIVPKHVGDAVFLADQVFDHSKVSMVDDMARLGLPPGNPFFAHDGSSGRLTYYYLLHFSAAELARLLGVSGWEADIAMTFFAAFTSLAVMMAVAVKFSGRTAASIWVLVVASSSSARVLLLALAGGPVLDAWLPVPGGSGGWLYQSSWVPQHLISTSCVLSSVLLLDRLRMRRGFLAIVATALVIAAGFESSTWVGGIVFAVAAIVVVPSMIVRAEPLDRRGFVAALAAVAVVVLLLIWPFLADQVAVSALRKSGFPIGLHPFDALGDAVPRAVRAWADLPAYWLVVLPVMLPAFYVTGLIVLVGALLGRGRMPSNTVAVHAYAVVALTSLCVSWLLVSRLADNNDLGWRAALLASTTLIVFASIGLASWVGERRWIATACAIALLALGLPEGYLQIQRNVVGHVQAEGRVFAEQPELWGRVRGLSLDGERIASNPLAMRGMTPWPVNIGWSLLADRRSCYAGWELAQVFTAVPHDELRTIDSRFVRVFGGDAADDDIRTLARVHDCDLAVITPQDGAWTRDPFRDSAFYRLVEERPERWRIYRRR